MRQKEAWKPLSAAQLKSTNIIETFYFTILTYFSQFQIFIEIDIYILYIDKYI